MPNKTQTEATLADLAIGIVSEKLPELLNFLVGFELITTNDERTKAAGILGFKIGEELVYMPILFLSGKVKGNEVLYLKNSDVFTSASKPWVDYLTSKSPGAMGKGETKHTLQQPSAQDLSIFHRSPLTGKQASLKVDKELFEGAADQFWDGIADQDLEAVHSLKRAEFTALNVLRSFGPVGQLGFMEMVANEFPEVAQKMAAMYELADFTQFDEFPGLPKKASSGEVGVRALGLDCGLTITPSSLMIASDTQIEAPAKVAFLTAGGWLRKCAYRGELPVVANITPQHDLFPEDIMSKVANDLTDADQLALADGSASLVNGAATPNGPSQVPPQVEPVTGPGEQPTASATPDAPSWWQSNKGNLVAGGLVGAGALGAYGAYNWWKNRKKEEPKVAELAFIDGEAVLNDAVAGLDDSQKTAAIRDGFLIIDRRPAYGMSKEGADEKFITEHETAKVEPIERFKVRLDTPRESGFYEILNVRGQMRRAFLAINPFVVEAPNFGHPSQIVVDPSSGRFHKVRAFENVFTTGRLSVEESKWKESYGSMPGVKSMKPGKVYMLLDGKQRSSAPFRVESKASSNGNTDFTVKTLWEFFYSCTCDDVPAGGRQLKVVDSDKFSDISKVGDFVFVPSDWKVIEVDDDYASTDAMKKLDREITPGNTGTASAAFLTGDMFKLRINKEPGGEKVKITAGDAQSDSMDTKTAAVVLTYKLRLPAGEAIEALHEAFTKGASLRCISGYNRLGLSVPKTAEDMTIPVDQIGTGHPLVLEQGMMGAHPSGFQEQEGFTERQPLDLNNLATPDQDWRDNDQANWDRIKPQETELLERALQSGHNPVFDSAMIGVLLRSSRASAQVAQWLPDLVNSLDTKCRLLLMFYWHNDDFGQDYGKDELAEFEDTLLDSIKRDGQLVLFLKQKSGESASVKIDALAEE